MHVIKRQRIVGIHSSRRQVHDYLGIRGDWVAKESAAAFHVKTDALAEAIRQQSQNPDALSIVVRDLEEA